MPSTPTRTRSLRRTVPPGAMRGVLVRIVGAGLACVLALLSVIDPTLGIAGALTIAIAVGFFQSATFGICAFTFFAYFDIITEYTGNPALSPIKVCGGALIVIGLLDLVTRARHGAGTRRPAPAWARHPIVLTAMVAFVGVGAASASWAVNTDQVKTLTIRLITEALVFIAIGVFLLRRHQLYALACTVLAAGVASTLAGIALHTEAFGRAIGTFTDPNEYASAMVVSIGMGFGAMGAARTAWGRRACVAGIALCTWGVLVSQSRGGLIAIAVAGAYVVLSSRGRERVRMMGATFVLLAAFVSMLMLTPTGQQSLERITNGDSSGRSDLWRIAILEFQDYPLHGVGLGNFPAVAKRYITAKTEHSELVVSVAPRTTHNSYLEIAAELGLLGLGTFTVFVGGCILLAMRGVRAARRLRDDGVVALGRGIVAATIGFFASCAFLSNHYSEIIWAMLATCVAYHAYVQRQLRLAAAIETAQEIVENLPVDQADVDLTEALAVAALGELDRPPELLGAPR